MDLWYFIFKPISTYLCGPKFPRLVLFHWSSCIAGIALLEQLLSLGTWQLPKDLWQLMGLHAPLHSPLWDLVCHWLKQVLFILLKPKIFYTWNWPALSWIHCIPCSTLPTLVLKILRFSSAKNPELWEMGLWPIKVQNSVLS